MTNNNYKIVTHHKTDIDTTPIGEEIINFFSSPLDETKGFKQVIELNNLLVRIKELQATMKEARLRILLTSKEASLFLNIPTTSLSQWRFRGHGPTYYKISGLVRYDFFELMDFLDSCQRKHTSDPGIKNENR